MPLCIVNKEYTHDPKGANNPDDFIQVLRGEVIKSPMGGDMLAAGYLSPIADSDAAEVVTCKCGRMFSGEEHVHFTQANLDSEVLAAQDAVNALEAGTEEHGEAVERVEEIKKRIAAEQKKHKPVPKKETVAA